MRLKRFESFDKMEKKTLGGPEGDKTCFHERESSYRMHIEKNVVDNIIGTLLNLDGKTNDNLKAR